MGTQHLLLLLLLTLALPKRPGSYWFWRWIKGYGSPTHMWTAAHPAPFSPCQRRRHDHPPLLLPCPPSPQALEPSYKGRCAFLKVDAQQNYQLAQHFKVSKLPTMLVFRGGVQASV